MMPKGRPVAGLGKQFNTSVAPEMPKNSAYSIAFSATALDDAWRRIFKNASPRSRNTIGIDDVSINDFRADEKSHLNRLSRTLRYRNFQFSSLRPHLIPKGNGKDRLICVPTVRDRIVQRALLEFLSTRYADRLANKISYGFVKSRGVKKAAEDSCAMRRAHPWVFKTDITSFFDSIDRERLVRATSSFVRERSLYPILKQAIACEVATVARSTGKRIQRLGIRSGQGVRQGMPLSPFFSNVMLASFDREIERAGLKALRYADDLIFFADSRQEAEAIEGFCRQELAKIGLTVPEIGAESKSVVYSPEQSAEFLGVSLVPRDGVYHVELTSQQIAVIRDELLKLSSVHELVARNISLPKLGQILAARRNGYLAAYDICRNVRQLENELANLEQKVLRKIYANGLGINLARLDGTTRRFLGLE